MAPKGFFTDTTLCIGCKACEVACKQWNQLPDDGFVWTGMSYDNTGSLGASTWRHVSFVEKATRLPMAPCGSDDTQGSHGSGGSETGVAWLMASDTCKHCARAGCLESCPTGAIIRTEFGSVFVQPDVCNGCGYCVVNCPFGVIDRRQDDGRVWKCTLCYDRQKDGLEPACAKACPTDSIVFGEVAALRAKAEERVGTLHERGVGSAYLYGASPEEQPGTEGLNAFFLLTDRPEVYNLPPAPLVPTKRVARSWRTLGLSCLALAAVAVAAASGRSA